MTLIRASLFFLVSCVAWGNIPVLSKYAVDPVSDQQMRQIAQQFEVLRTPEGGYEVVVPASSRESFVRLAPNAELKEADMRASLMKRLGYDLHGWRNFQTVQTELNTLVAQYPNLATLENYGKSKEGRPLLALKLASHVDAGREKPAIAITGATHGDELITVEVVMGLLNLLVQGYGKNERLTKMVDSYQLYFIPVVSPDGYVYQSRHCNGIDPNRDYPYPENPNKQSNPAIKNIMNFFQAKQIKGSLDYHSSGAMIMFPWAYTYSRVPSVDYQVFDEVTSEMAETNGYRHGQISTTIYIAPGSSADYYYWKLGTRALGIEIRSDGSSSLIPSMLRENTESTWRFVESF